MGAEVGGRNEAVFICKLLLAQHLLLNAINSFSRLVMAEGAEFNFGARKAEEGVALTRRAHGRTGCRDNRVSTSHEKIRLLVRLFNVAFR